MDISFRILIKNGLKNDMREGKKKEKREREKCVFFQVFCMPVLQIVLN